MRHLIVLLGFGFVAFQFVLIVALMIAVKRPTPQFKPEPNAALEPDEEALLAAD